LPVTLYQRIYIAKVASRLATLIHSLYQTNRSVQSIIPKVYTTFTVNMYTKSIISAFSALVVLGNAVPLNNGKRDLVWVTEIETAIETIGVTTTVWVDPTPTAEAHNHHRHKHSSANSQPAVEVKPTPSPASSSSSEAPVAPASSYEAPPAPYVAPTTSTPEPEPATTAQAQQTSSTPEPEPAPTQAAVTPESSYVAPVSSYEAPSSTYVAPVASYEAPSSTYEAPAASSAPASYSSGSSSSGDNPAAGKSFTGEMTYFTPGMGACGHESSESEEMVAISKDLFDQYTPNGNPNKNPLCGQTVDITSADGTTRKATIWDRCVGCAEGDLDMPQSFFNQVTKNKEGVIADGRAYGMSWSIQ
jgi:hypothetical protein